MTGQEFDQILVKIWAGLFKAGDFDQTLFCLAK